jgi:DNA-binding XRE family transcriptional regulator
VTDQQVLRLIGRHVREARLKANMTQECLAELVGVHWKTVGNIERGNYPIALTTFARLCQFLESSPNRLLDGMEPPDPKRTARIKKALARKRAPANRSAGHG